MMTIIAVVISFMKVSKQVQDQYRFHTIFKQLIKGNPSAMNIVLLLLDCFVNVILSMFTVFLTFFLISKSDETIDLVLNCLAITFIVELDEDLNHRDPVEVNDLVIQSFKKYLIKDMMRKSYDISQQHKHNGGKIKYRSNCETIEGKVLSYLLSDDFLSLKSTQCCDTFKMLDRADLLIAQLDSADYTSDSTSLNENKEIFEAVRTYIKEGRLLPILNDRFSGDPDPGMTKFLLLRFKNNLTIKVREKLVVDFAVVDKMLNKPDALLQKTVNTRNAVVEKIVKTRDAVVDKMVKLKDAIVEMVKSWATVVVNIVTMLKQYVIMKTCTTKGAAVVYWLTVRIRFVG